MLTRKKIQTSILLIAGIVLLINFLANKFYFRLDYTEDQRYSLSSATENILSDLNDLITVTAYFSEDLPPDIAKVKQDFKDLLIEYANKSDGQVVYEFINPSETEETEMQAQQNGIQPIMINVRERDQMKQQRAYLGAVIQSGEKKEVIPFIQPGAAMEFALSTNIKKITLQEKPRIAFIQGHGEPSISAMQQLNSQLSVLYTVESVSLSDSISLSGNYKAVILIAPKDTIPPNDFTILDEYLITGGKILIGLNTVQGDLNTGAGSKLFTGVESWLKEKGIEVEDNFVVDASCASVMVRQQQGMFVMNTPVKFPYVPVASNFSEHPITEGLESVAFQFASTINILPKDTSALIYPIVFSSEKSGVQNAPLYFDVMKQWSAADFSMSSLPLAVISEGVNGNQNSKLIVFSDGDFVINGEGQGAQQVEPDNINLMINSIDWLSDDTGLIELRTKGITSRPLDASLEDGTKTLLKYLNFLAPIILIIIFGVLRLQLKRNIRKQLMNTEYVQ